MRLVLKSFELIATDTSKHFAFIGSLKAIAAAPCVPRPWGRVVVVVVVVGGGGWL